jgi:titin
LTWEAPEDDGGSPITHYTIYSGTVSNDLEYLYQVGNVLTYTDTMYLPDTTFYYQVAAVNSIGTGPRSNEVASDPDLPSSPVLSAEVASTTVTLTWAAPDEGSSAITNYRVYRGADGGSMSLLIELGNVLTYEDSTGTVGETYVYQVAAVNDQGEGPRSNSVSVLLGAVPSEPIHLGASAEVASIVLTWDEPVDDGGFTVTGYKVYRGASADNLALKATPGAVLNYTDYDVVAGTIYYYAVSAVNEIGEGNSSSVISVKADSLPSAPTHLEAEAGDATVTLSWNAPTDDGGSPITGYVIYRGTAEGAVSTVLVTLGNVTTYTDDDVVNGQTYWYKVSAFNTIGQGATTDVVDATPSADAGDGGDGMILIIIAIVAIAAVAGVAVFLLKRKK